MSHPDTAALGNQCRILVTGGAGFIGSHLVERLLADGHSVVVVDDLSTGRLENLATVASHPNLQVVLAKVSACPDLPGLVTRADFIFHLAAAVGVDLVMTSCLRAMETNLRETQSLLDAASRVRKPFLLASTSEVYGKSQRPAFSEEDDLMIGPPHLARWSYACSKLADEFLALAHFRDHGTPAIIVRLFNTVGPRQSGQYGMVLPRFIEAARRGAPLRVYGDGQQTRCFCDVADTVEALVRLWRCPGALGQVVNVGGVEETSMLDLAKLVIAVLASKSLIETIPYEVAYGSGFEDMRHRRPVVDKLDRLTGFRPATHLRDIIRRTASG